MNKDSLQHSISQFKSDVFIWEIIITTVVFTAAWFILRRYKLNEKAAREKNRKYETGR